MNPEEKGVFVRILSLATGITAITTVLVLSSVVGMNAYLAYQPSSLEAQVIEVPTSISTPSLQTIQSEFAATTSASTATTSNADY